MGQRSERRERGYGRFNCYVCRRELNAAGILFNDVMATVRVFSGQYSGGFAACAQHAATAIEDALKPLLDPKFRVDQNYRVKAFRVDCDERGEPKLGPVLFSARRRQASAAQVRA